MKEHGRRVADRDRRVACATQGEGNWIWNVRGHGLQDVAGAAVMKGYAIAFVDFFGWVRLRDCACVLGHPDFGRWEVAGNGSMGRIGSKVRSMLRSRLN